MPISTARSEFTEDVQDKDGFNCNGCYEPIVRGSRIFTKDYLTKLNKPAKVRLHNLDECWESFVECSAP